MRQPVTFTKNCTAACTYCIYTYDLPAVPLGEVLFTGDHTKYDLRYTQKATYFSIFTNNIWSYLLWSPVNKWSLYTHDIPAVPLGEKLNWMEIIYLKTYCSTKTAVVIFYKWTCAYRGGTHFFSSLFFFRIPVHFICPSSSCPLPPYCGGP